MTYDPEYSLGTEIPGASGTAQAEVVDTGADDRAGDATPAVTESAQPARRRGFTIRLKLTLWCGGLFLLAGIALISINYFMVRDSLVVAPERARAAIAARYNIDPQLLEPGHFIQVQPGGPPLQIQSIQGIPVPQLIADAQRELRDEALRQLWIRSILALAIMTVVAFGLAWLIAGRMLRPIHRIADTARRLSGSTLHERIALKGPRDELKDLADTFDDMLSRLDATFTAQKEFVANASHELRTPLTIIRTEIDVALNDPSISQAELQEMGTAVGEAVERSERLIDSLLVLARAEEPPILVDLDLAEITGNEVAQSSSEADALGLRLELDLQPAPVKGERSLLERMVSNLVENATRHNLPDGWFSVKTSVSGGHSILEVANGGNVIAPEDASKLFERFFRPDKSRSRRTGGFGLGLSIVKSVATALGGSVDLIAPRTGGLRVTVSLPEAQAADRGSDS
jgi:signal transduction histidine kinase